MIDFGAQMYFDIDVENNDSFMNTLVHKSIMILKWQNHVSFMHHFVVDRNIVILRFEIMILHSLPHFLNVIFDHVYKRFS